jgi:DNA-binding NtrC family response regulator
VYSEPGQGATFKIYLPLIAEVSDAVTPEREAPALPCGSETILLVEDESAVRNVARQILERYGYTVIEAAGGKQALDLAAKMPGTIHLLLTDVVMPEMSGRVLGERFAEMKPGIRILYMSGYTDDAVVRHGILQANIAYLPKPFSTEALARKVREVLDSPNG